MKNGNTGSGKPKENPYLDAYEAFLNFVEETLNESIPANVRNQNYNLFSRFYGNIAQLLSVYKIEAQYDSPMVGESIRKRKQEILTGQQFMMPSLQIEGEKYKVKQLTFVSKKDTLGSMRERVGNKVRGIFGKEPVLDNI